MSKKTLITCFLLSFMFSLFCSTASAADKKFEQVLEDVLFVRLDSVITASKYVQPIDQSPMAINVITAADIERSGAKNFADLVKRLPGAWTWVKCRTDYDIGLMGMLEDDNCRTLILLDGQSIGIPMFDGMQWPQFPIVLEEVERIEIIRGAGSAIYGANAVTGIMNIITKPAMSRKDVFNMYVGAGGIQNYTYTLAAPVSDKLDVSLTAGWRKTGNKESQDVVHNTGDMHYYSTPVLNLKMDYEGSSSQKLSLYSGYSIGDGGYGASPGEADIDRVKGWEYYFVQLNYENNLSESAVLSVKSESLGVHQSNYRPYGSYWPEVPNKYNVRGQRRNLEMNITSRYPDHTLLTGVQYHYCYANSMGETTNLDPGRIHRWELFGIFIQDEYNIRDTLFLTASLRSDSYSDIDDEVTGRLTALYKFNEKNILRLSGGNSYRRPDIYSKHYYVQIGPDGYFIGGGNKVRSQKVTYYDAEYRNRAIPNHIIKVGVSRFNLTNVYFSDFLGVTVNGMPQIQRSSSGHEYVVNGYIAEIEGTLFEDEFKWYSNITYLDSKDNTSEVEMEDVPNTMLNAGMQYYYALDFYLSMDVHYQDSFKDVDASVTDSVNGVTGPIDAYSTVDAKIGYFPSESIEVSLSVENLFNDVHYEFPVHWERERTVYAGVRMTWF